MRKAILIWLAMVAVASADPWAARLGEWASLQQRRAVVDAWEAAGLNEGLISYWAMRTSGTTVIDEYGSNDGTAVNTPTFSEANGVRDDGVGLNGTNQRITIPHDDTLSVGDEDFSVFAWIKLEKLNANQGIFVKRRPTDTPLYGYRLFVSSDNKARHNVTGSVATAPATSGGSTLSTGVWYHVGMTVSGATNSRTIIYWLNGNNDREITGANTGTVDPTLQNGFIGTDRSGIASYFGGSIDEVAIWNRALSSNEVYQIYSTPLYAPYKQ